MQAEQMVLQRVLRALSVTSGASVCITDSVGRGIEETQEGEVGRLLPFSLGGLEFFCDLVLEASLEMVDFQLTRRFRVVKSNIGELPIGQVFTDIGFADLIGYLRDHGAWEPLPGVPPSSPVSLIPAPAAATILADPGLAREAALAAFLARADRAGLSPNQVVASANAYCQKSDPSLLSLADLGTLEKRLDSYIATKAREAAPDPAAPNQEEDATAGPPRAPTRRGGD